MEAERPPASGSGCGRPPLRTAGRDPATAPVSVPAPPQVPGVGRRQSSRCEDGVGLHELWAPGWGGRGRRVAARVRGSTGLGWCPECFPPRRPEAGPGRGHTGRSRFGGGHQWIWVAVAVAVAVGVGTWPLPALSRPRPQGPAVEFALPQEPEPRAADLGAPGAGAAGPPTLSAHIPVPAHRTPPGKARLDEVMAATALTSLSTSPLLLGAPGVTFSTEPCLEPWREAPVQPPGSGGSWDPASDQSSPSTPSPPLPPEAAHFLFGESTLRKRKSSLQGLFQCLWKRCGKVLSSASGMQRHIRLVHLGRQAELEQSDGEEDFYYTELDSGMDSLTDGLSGLTPGSPTALVPPAFPRLEPPEPLALPSLLRLPALPLPPVLSTTSPSQVCPSDHAHQVGEVTGGSQGARGHSSASSQGCLAPVRLEPQTTPVRACVPALPAKPSANPRKPRGDAKKCRKVYGMDHRDLWCTACRWKKACQRFLD